MAAMDAVSVTPSSPRISFSHHLSQKDESFSSTRDYPYTSESNSDFNFCNFDSAETITSSADEIFSNGFILPLHQKPHQSSVSSPVLDKGDEKILTETEQVKSQSKAFWRIRRSSSLHCEGSHKRGSTWSLHPLPRSSSTGSKQTKSEKRHKFKSATNSSSPNSSSVHFYEFPFSSQKPPLFRTNHGNGVVRINPVLNVPPPSCIYMGTTNLFGLGSLFRSGKDKKTIKK